MRNRHGAILLRATALMAGDDKFSLGLNDWRVLRDTLAVESEYSIEVNEWPDGLWSCTYGLQTGPLVVNLGNMPLGEWLRREAFWA